jgi:hypothetical protein
MKKLITVLILLILAGTSGAQQASDYFPTQTGFEWKFKQTPLDSAQNPIPSLAVFRIDSFASVANYQGRMANIVPTKTGPLQTILLQPYLDSLFYSTEGTNGFEYFSIRNIEEFLIAIDTSGIISNLSVLELFLSFQNWYSYYRFASPVNTEYNLIQKDTTVIINSVGYYLRFKYDGNRLPDQTIQTVLGSFNCKKFLLKWRIIYFIIPPPFPGLEIFSTNDTIWIAPDNWIVQDIIPANYVDFSLLGIPPFTIPGLETKLTDEIVSVTNEVSAIPDAFSLEQNYPNPFNPSTTISWQSPVGSHQTLKVYDLLGKEVATLVDEFKPAGRYEVEFNASKLSSGTYFYRLRAGSFIETKKMLILK